MKMLCSRLCKSILTLRSFLVNLPEKQKNELGGSAKLQDPALTLKEWFFPKFSI